MWAGSRDSSVNSCSPSACWGIQLALEFVRPRPKGGKKGCFQPHPHPREGPANFGFGLLSGSVGLPLFESLFPPELGPLAGGGKRNQARLEPAPLSFARGPCTSTQLPTAASLTETQDRSVEAEKNRRPRRNPLHCLAVLPKDPTQPQCWCLTRLTKGVSSAVLP